MMQPDIFDPPRARMSDPATSHAAGRRVAEFSHAHASVILAALQRRPMTFHEIARATGLDGQQVNKRLPELERAGQAVPTDEMRRSPSGRQCRVWRAA